MGKIIEISESLWLDVWDGSPEYNDGLFYIRDGVGGNTLIDYDEVPKLIEVLQSLLHERAALQIGGVA